jgi:hypothetical protein
MDSLKARYVIQYIGTWPIFCFLQKYPKFDAI